MTKTTIIRKPAGEHTAAMTFGAARLACDAVSLRFDDLGADLNGAVQGIDGVSILNIPLKTMDQLAIEYLKARRLKLATVITWYWAEGNDETEVRGHTELIDRLHINRDNLREEPAECPICGAPLEREQLEPRYEFQARKMTIWDESAQDWTEKEIRERIILDDGAGDFLPCGTCGYDWALDDNDDDKIVAAALVWQRQKEAKNAAAGD